SRLLGGDYQEAIGAASARQVTRSLPMDRLHISIRQPCRQKPRQPGLNLYFARQASLYKSGPTSSFPAKRAQNRLDKKQERNHGGHRIPRKSEKVMLSKPAEDNRLTRLD